MEPELHGVPEKMILSLVYLWITVYRIHRLNLFINESKLYSIAILNILKILTFINLIVHNIFEITFKMISVEPFDKLVRP